MPAHDALSLAIITLNAQGQTAAAQTLQAILIQRGCEHLDPACESLTDLIDVVVYG